VQGKGLTITGSDLGRPAALPLAMRTGPPPGPPLSLVGNRCRPLIAGLAFAPSPPHVAGFQCNAKAFGSQRIRYRGA
jgi:hypothetical protein